MNTHEAFDSAYYLLKSLIAIPSRSREEAEAADYLCAFMKDISGQEVHRLHNNLWLVDPHYDASRPTLLLNAHLDTVKPVSSWTRDPFTPQEEMIELPDGSWETRLYGLGSNDDGASLVTLLHVYLLLVSRPQTYNLIFLASAEEEVSGKNGIECVLPLLPAIHTALVGEPTGMQPAVAEKGLVVLDGKAFGKAGHAARNEGINALYTAVEAISKIKEYQFEKVSETLGPIKATVTGIQAGTTHNVIPDSCTFMVDCRTTDAYSNEEVVALLQKLTGAVESEVGADIPCLTLQPRSTRLQPSSISPAHPLLRRIIAAGREPFGSPTLSDQALMRFPSIKMGPGQSSRSHTADEYICTKEIEDAIRIYFEVLDGLSLK